MRLKSVSSDGVLSVSGWGDSGFGMGCRQRASARTRTVERGGSFMHIFLFFVFSFFSRIGG